MVPKKIEQLIEKFTEFPSIGRKSAERMVYFLLGRKDDFGFELGKFIANLKNEIHFCKLCGFFSNSQNEVCNICKNIKKNHNRICVVETFVDVLAIEQTHADSFVYHILGGVLSPIEKVTPDKLNLEKLYSRINQGTEEIILAMNPSIDGESTALYLANVLKKMKQQKNYQFKITRIARGLPTGSVLEYADNLTIESAINGRKEM